MKKVWIATLIVGTVIASSCSKTYNCECTETYSGTINSVNQTNTTISDVKRSEAEDICKQGDSEQTILTETKTVECELN